MPPAQSLGHPHADIELSPDSIIDHDRPNSDRDAAAIADYLKKNY
jgi:hypothetical protein